MLYTSKLFMIYDYLFLFHTCFTDCFFVTQRIRMLCILLFFLFFFSFFYGCHCHCCFAQIHFRLKTNRLISHFFFLFFSHFASAVLFGRSSYIFLLVHCANVHFICSRLFLLHNRNLSI